MKKIALLIMIFTVSVSMYACGRKTDNQKKETPAHDGERSLMPE